MTNPSAFPPPPTDSAYIAHLWDYPQCQTSAVTGGEGRSQERQRRFAEAAQS